MVASTTGRLRLLTLTLTCLAWSVKVHEGSRLFWGVPSIRKIYLWLPPLRHEQPYALIKRCAAVNLLGDYMLADRAFS